MQYIICDLGNLKDEKIVCLTLDIEQDYGELLNKPSYEALQHVQELVDYFKAKNIPLTCFIQGSLFETHPAQIESLVALNVEFELHSYSHPNPKKMDVRFEVEKGKEAYERFFAKSPKGYRAPLGVINEKDYGILLRCGFNFDSSVCPSIRPGVFNNLLKPMKPYLLESSGVVEFPITVFSSFIRVPLNLSFANLLGKLYFYLLKNCNLSNFIVFNFHLHDLFQLDSAKKFPLKGFSPVSRLIFNRIYQKQSGKGLVILDKLITLFKQRGYKFYKLVDIYDAI